MVEAESPEQADVVVVNTCAFIDIAREESIDTVLQMAEVRNPDAKLVVTGCMAERYGDEQIVASVVCNEGFEQVLPLFGID